MSALSVIPLTSEKAYALAAQNVYLFKVPLRANKQQIAASVEAQFGVSVVSVKSLVAKGKTLAFSRGKRARPGRTRHSDIKKAYVTLAEGDSIKVFDEKQAEGEEK